MKKHIYLIGFMGTGKTSVSNKLKDKLNMREVEMDAVIVKENDMSIQEIFDQFGEEYFRDKETRLLHRIANIPPAIISCGGGTVVRPENVELMKSNGNIILLTATPETVYNRVKNGRERPLLNGNMNVEYISAFMEKRRAIYESAKNFAVATDGKTPAEVADEIIKLIGE